MDFLGSRAIPALIAAFGAFPAAAADCSALDGAYQFKSALPGSSRELSMLTPGPANSKLRRVDEPGKGPKSLAGGTVIQRPKTTLVDPPGRKPVHSEDRFPAAR